MPVVAGAGGEDVDGGGSLVLRQRGEGEEEERRRRRRERVRMTGSRRRSVTRGSASLWSEGRPSTRERKVVKLSLWYRASRGPCP